MFPDSSRCDRCFGPTISVIMSMFNQQSLCPQCKKEEEAHPDYEKAREAEASAVKSGNYNFPGVGWPGKNGRL